MTEPTTLEQFLVAARKLIAGQAQGTLTEAEEDELGAVTDHLWWQLTPDERVAAETEIKASR